MNDVERLDVIDEYKRVFFEEGGSWEMLADCKDVDPEMMHPSPSRDRQPLNAGEIAAKKICEGCIVQKECLDKALENNEPSGIWGGLAEKERIAYRRNRLGRPLSRTAIASA